MSTNNEIIEKLAIAVRENLNSIEKNVNMLDVLTELGILFEENESNQPVEPVYKDPNGTYVVSLNRKYDPRNPSDKFKLAHELGHLFLHVDFVNDGDVFGKMGSNQAEYDANEFAAHFLMPSQLFLDEINTLTNANKVDVHALAATFGVSYNAALTRGRFLGAFAW